MHLQKQIKKQISVYEEMFQFTSQISWDTVKDHSREFQVTIQSLTPDLYAEMEGIAEGAGLDVLDIVALNCRSELGVAMFTNVSDGCTSVSWKKSENSRILAQNWDWTSLVQGNLVCMSIEQADKPKVYMVTEVSSFSQYLQRCDTNIHRLVSWVRSGSIALALAPPSTPSKPIPTTPPNSPSRSLSASVWRAPRSKTLLRPFPRLEVSRRRSTSSSLTARSPSA